VICEISDFEFFLSVFGSIHLGLAFLISAMAIVPATTSKLQVYLNHLRHGGCEYGLEHLPCFVHLFLRSKSKKEKILWTKSMRGHLLDLEVISGLAYQNYVACLLAESGAAKS
jgi:hypothetical protein